MSLPVLPAASMAVTVIVLFPDCKVMPVADQSAFPEAVPEPPLLLTQLTCVTPTLSTAEPPIAMVAVSVE